MARKAEHEDQKRLQPPIGLRYLARGIRGAVAARKADWPPAATRPSGRVSEDTRARRGRTNKSLVHFTFRIGALYPASPVSAGYGDKLLRAIDATDPGAVPGGSTTWAEQHGQHA